MLLQYCRSMGFRTMAKEGMNFYRDWRCRNLLVAAYVLVMMPHLHLNLDFVMLRVGDVII